MSHDHDKCCLNCGTPLTDAFCPHCGQKASVKRLSVKSAIIDNTWSILRMDGRVLPTICLLITRPWLVIRDYIKGHRVAFTQPVRLIVILCFVSIILQMFLPDMDNGYIVDSNEPIAEGFAMRILHSVQGFLRESEVALDLIDSVIFVPIVWLLYLPWGSRRFNVAEYSTAYLYLCAAGLCIDLVTLPVKYLSDELCSVIQFFWWFYLLSELVKHAFHIEKRLIRVLLIIVNFVLLFAIGLLNRYFILGDHSLFDFPLDI